MTVVNRILNRIDNDVANLKQGLQPENLGYWYNKIIVETKGVTGMQSNEFDLCESKRVRLGNWTAEDVE